MTVQKWFENGAVYGSDGQVIFAKQGKNILQITADIRGWGYFRHLFETNEEAIKFEDEIGQFITDAINEKLERELTKGAAKTK